MSESSETLVHKRLKDLRVLFRFQAYGIKFIISVDGLARKFSLKNTVLNVGNGLALLGITTVLCEFVLMYFIKVRIIDETLGILKHEFEYGPASALAPKDDVLFADIVYNILNTYFITLSSDW